MIEKVFKQYTRRNSLICKLIHWIKIDIWLLFLDKRVEEDTSNKKLTDQEAQAQTTIGQTSLKDRIMK